MYNLHFLNHVGVMIGSGLIYTLRQNTIILITQLLQFPLNIDNVIPIC